MKGIVRLRLARFGRKHQPVYNIVVTKNKKARDAFPIEVLGTYNPVATPLTPQQRAAGEMQVKQVQLDFSRSQYWLGVGAQPTDAVAKLFKRAGILPETWPGPGKSIINEAKELAPARKVE